MINVDIESSLTERGYGSDESEKWVNGIIDDYSEKFNKTSQVESSTDPVNPNYLTAEEKRRALKYIVNAVANFSRQQSSYSGDVDRAVQLFFNRFGKVYGSANGLDYLQSDKVIREMSEYVEEKDKQWAAIGAVMGLLFKDGINPDTKVYLIKEMIKNPKVKQALWEPAENDPGVGVNFPVRYWPLAHVLSVTSTAVHVSRKLEGEQIGRNFMKGLSEKILTAVRPPKV